MIDKKTGLMSGVFGGIGFYCIPIFAKGLPALPFKIAGGIVMTIGVIYFIAGDVIFKGISGGYGYNKNIKKKLKSGELTPTQAFELQKKELENQLALERQKLELAEKKAEIEKIKQKAKPKPMDLGFGGGSNSKMPDVLGNLGPVISNPKKKKDNDDLRKLF